MKAIKPCTINPGTNRAANQKHRPLMTNENSPKLKKLIGSDNTDSTGRTVEFTPPTATAASKAAGKLAIVTPGTTKSTTSKPKAVAKVVTRYPMRLLFIYLQLELN